MYKWADENQDLDGSKGESNTEKSEPYFILSKDNSIAVGGGDHFAIWLDGNFRYGSSLPCQTFRSPQLSSQPQFLCHELEVWGFEMVTDDENEENVELFSQREKLKQQRNRNHPLLKIHTYKDLHTHTNTITTHTHDLDSSPTKMNVYLNADVPTSVRKSIRISTLPENNESTGPQQNDGIG